MDYLPVFLDLRDRWVVVVGGGTVAARKAALLHAAGARLRIVAPQCCDELRELCQSAGAEYLAQPFAPAHLVGMAFAVAATDAPGVNSEVARAGRAANIWVNAVDDPGASSCLMPSIVDRSPVIVAIGTGGASPTLARRLRGQIEALLPQRLGELAKHTLRWRAQVRATLPSSEFRQRFWEGFFDSSLSQQLLAEPVAAEAAQRAFELQLQHAHHSIDGHSIDASPRGMVWLIGAGPGDPDLLTLRAQQLLQQCDVVLYDRLVPEAILGRVRRDAERIFVGKEPGHHRTTQARIHELLLYHARRGQRVARLKGGDPMVFARGGEELLALAAAGIPVIVVPGVTAALGAAASAQIPLTHRGLAQSICFVTAMGAAAEALDWRALAAPLQTVVVYMGAAQLPIIAARLIQFGAPPERTAALIEHATLPNQRVIAGTLATIAAQATAARIGAPALLVVGEVARFAAGDAPGPVGSQVRSKPAAKKWQA